MPKLSFNNGNFSHYNLSISFDPISSSVTGNLTVDYYNNDPLNLTKIPFHLFLSGMVYYTRIGSIEILNVTTFNVPRTPLYFEINESAQLLWVYLESELEPYHRVKFEITFKSIIPDGSTEIGFDRAGSYGSDGTQSRIYKFSAFYPMPCVYDKYDGWNTDPYLWVGDPFYYDMAYYNLFLEAPNDFVIAATGELIKKTDKGANNLYHFSPMFPVREITFSASKWFIVESDVIRGVNISVYYIPESQFIWQTYALNYGIQALTLFNQTFGNYTYSTFNIVEEYTNYGGMEYPCQVYITEALDEWPYPLWGLERIIVHETSHQWWYNLVGNDEVDWGFLDEGLACWSTDYYAEINYGNWEYFQYTRYIDRVRTYYIIEGLPSRINASVYDAIHADNYIFTGYYKAPLILEKLRRTIGNTIFLNGLKLYFTQNVYKIAMLSDLQLAMESIYGSSLDWFFFPWYDNPYLPKYNFLEFLYDDNQQILEVTIIDLNEPLNNYPYSQQVQLLIYDSNGLVYNEWIWINGTTTINISLVNKPNRLRLEYGDEVLVQLYSEDITYLEKSLEKPPLISGYNVSIFCLLSLIPITYIIYRSSVRKKKNL
ncbi:MAG: M1 family metallopeptidase [Promethearchaeota archaeon]